VKILSELIKKDIEALKLFNEKAEKLAQLIFTETMFNQRTKVEINYETGKGFKVLRKGPDSENIDAMALTLRFFMQNNEPCSLRNLSKIYIRLPINKDIKEKFSQARNSINNYLDSQSLIKYIFNFKSLSNRDILDTFMYGGLAHSKYKKKYDKWMRSPIAPAYTNEFCSIAAEMVRLIHYYIREFNKIVIKEIESMRFIKD